MVSTRAKNAARVAMEFEGLEMRLSDARTDALDILDRVVLTETQEYFLDSTAAMRVSLYEAEWALYRYASLLHALDEMVDNTKFVNKTTVKRLRDIPHALIAIRNCIQHNGPVGLNYDDSIDEVVLDLGALENQGDWHKSNVPSFSHYFPSYNPSKAQYLEVEKEIQGSKQIYENLISDCVGEIEQRIGKSKLEKAANSVTIYS